MKMNYNNKWIIIWIIIMDNNYGKNNNEINLKLN